MMGNGSSQSLHEMMRDTLLRNVSRDTLDLMMHDSLSRNVSNVSLTELVRNYSSGSLEAVMEQGEAWPDHSDHANYPSGATYPSNEQPHSYSWQAPATVSPKVRQSLVPACSVPSLLLSALTCLCAQQCGRRCAECCGRMAKCLHVLPKCCHRMPSDARQCAAEPL
jgi:hypothetical protein